ncbi:hypothetical protein EON65_32240 [archaeon]|nr:MAG: hypothetical protein EON65_32240 [archaeon]
MSLTSTFLSPYVHHCIKVFESVASASAYQAPIQESSGMLVLPQALAAIYQGTSTGHFPSSYSLSNFAKFYPIFDFAREQLYAQVSIEG